MPTTNNNFFVYIGDNWEQINPDFTNEVEYLQQLIVILNNKIDEYYDRISASVKMDRIRWNGEKEDTDLTTNKTKFQQYMKLRLKDIILLCILCLLI